MAVHATSGTEWLKSQISNLVDKKEGFEGFCSTANIEYSQQILFTICLYLSHLVNKFDCARKPNIRTYSHLFAVHKTHK